MFDRILHINKSIKADNIFVYAAQASFFIIIAALPFFMLLLSLVQFLLPISEDDIIVLSNAFLPDFISPALDSAIYEIFHKTSGLIISISALSTLWTASRAVAAIERGIRSVYHVSQRKNFIVTAVASLFYTVVSLLLITAFLAVFVFGKPIFLMLSSQKLHLVSTIFHTDITPSILRPVLSFVFTSILFAGAYTAFSAKKLTFSINLPGAAFTSFAWVTFSLLYSFYINNFADYSYIYGSLTAIVLMMLWVYFCMVIFLIGAEINTLILPEIKDFIKTQKEND